MRNSLSAQLIDSGLITPEKVEYINECKKFNANVDDEKKSQYFRRKLNDERRLTPDPLFNEIPTKRANKGRKWNW